MNCSSLTESESETAEPGMATWRKTDLGVTPGEVFCSWLLLVVVLCCITVSINHRDGTRSDWKLVRVSIVVFYSLHELDFICSFFILREVLMFSCYFQFL